MSENRNVLQRDLFIELLLLNSSYLLIVFYFLLDYFLFIKYYYVNGFLSELLFNNLNTQKKRTYLIIITLHYKTKITKIQ